MKVSIHRVDLPLEHEFRIARGSMNVQRSLIVELDHDGTRGYGEATENRYYGYTLASMENSIERCRSTIEGYEFGSPAALWEILRPDLMEDVFALSAIDLAAHDLFGKLVGRHTYDMLGLDWVNVPQSSYTIGIDRIDQMLLKLSEQPDWPVYKIKLGAGCGVDVVRQLRDQTRATFRVDANCSWNADEAIENSHQLKKLGVEFIEQPLSPDNPRSDHRLVFAESALPIIADESCLVEEDVEACHGLFHGINVKLCKCGGITPAVRMLRRARSLGMKTMVGCMIESSVGISAAAQLLPLLDYADLDGAVLLSRDAAVGVTVENGNVNLSRRRGNGVELLGPT